MLALSQKIQIAVVDNPAAEISNAVRSAISATAFLLLL